MRIGIVTGEYPPMQGGVGAYTHILAHELVKAGCSLQLLSSPQASSADLPLTHIARWTPGSLRTIRHWAIANRLELINLQFQTAAFQMSPWVHFLPQLLRPLPVVTTFHDLRFPYLFPKAGPLRDWIVLHLARKSSGVIVTNHEDLQRLSALSNTTLIPIGSNISISQHTGLKREEWRARAGADERHFLIAYFGFINRSKGVGTLLEALALLVEQYHVPAKLVMIGGHIGASDPTNAAYFAEVEAKIVQLRLGPMICWTGFVDDTEVSAYLDAADSVALPFVDGASYRRGSLMAAIRHGCAIVTTQPQVKIASFVHKENMLFSPAADAGALAKNLAALYNSPELRQRLKQGARALATEFDWAGIARAYIHFFEKIMGADD